MSKARPARPVSAAQAADWPRLSEARGSSLMHALPLKEASGESQLAERACATLLSTQA